ncbi:RHS repeat domain-containing protein [Brevundimonas sp.]|uniref:RHS repeat domain-containing protein n=1 Tax=Brevundimonas sp. TaxID=1871086 RepID=UPI002E156CB4|nr:RHS repeat domain-containing protein [Brevundimonas sp.]
MSHDRRSTLRQLLAASAFLAASWPKAAFAKDPVIYTYDALGRLTSAAYPNGVTITYAYDPAGNRIQVVAASPPPPPPPGPLTASASASTWFSGPSGEDPPVAVTISGGTPPYFLTWQKVSGNPATQAVNPSGTPTTWVFTGTPGFPWQKVSTWRCQVSDSASAVVFTSDVAVTIDVS